MTFCLIAGDVLKDLGINFKVLGTQVVIFLITFLVLSRILFGRVLSHLRRREEEVRQREEGIARQRQEIDTLAAQYEAHIAMVEKEAYDRMQAVLREGLKAGEGILAQAQQEAKQQIDSARKAIVQEREAAGERLRSEAVGMTLDACRKILQMPLNEAQDRPIVEEAVRQSK